MAACAVADSRVVPTKVQSMQAKVDSGGIIDRDCSGWNCWSDGVAESCSGGNLRAASVEVGTGCSIGSRTSHPGASRPPHPYLQNS